MKERDKELFDRRMPADHETERRALGALLLVADAGGHEAFGQLDPMDFCLGYGGFNGWLFSRIRSGRQCRRSTLEYLLTRKNRREARRLGVGNLAAALASLLVAQDGRYRPGLAMCLPEYVQRLRAVRRLRRAIWDAEEAYRRAWREWERFEAERP